MKGIRPLADYRVLISRCVIGSCLLFLALRGLCGLLPHQLQQPVLTSFHYDLTMWVYKLSGLSHLVAQDPATSRLFTALLFVSGGFAFWFPLQRRFIVPFTLLFLLTAINFNFYLTHNSHYLAGAVWLLFTFWPKKDESFNLLWEGLRYYTCWIYGVAFIWKVVYGAFFQWDAGVLSCRENLAGYLYQNPETGTAHFYYYMLGHPVWLNLGHKLVCLAEGTFLLGFFTKRFDRLLIALMFLIHISTYLFADVFFAELMILAFTLVPSKTWEWMWYKTVPASVHSLLKNR